MFMFGLQCVRCNHEMIAPRNSEFLADGVIRHVWHCPKCKARFEIISSVSCRRKIGERGDDEGGYIFRL